MWLPKSCYHCSVPGAICLGTIKVCFKRKGRGDCGVKPILGICLAEAT